MRVALLKLRTTSEGVGVAIEIEFGCRGDPRARFAIGRLALFLLVENVLLDIAELNLETIPGATLDMVPENMDSEDLVSSLQEEFNAEILNDVEALLNKEAVMKWL
ncbi:transcriptional coactivator YAP1 [Trichonephila clavipes]|nr:transcriptional coactivator YAP1 [Trichonephila clavipes]